MKDLREIVKEFKKKINCKNAGYSNNNGSTFKTYETISEHTFDGKYFDVCFTENLKNRVEIEISHTTDCVDYVLGIIKEIEPNASVTSYQTTLTKIIN